VTFNVLGSVPTNKENTFTIDFGGPTNPHPTTPFQFTVQDSTGAPVSTSVTLPECAASGPSLAITKTVDVTLAPRYGDQVIFEIVVTNVGTAPTSGNVTVTDSLPDGLQYESAVNGSFDGFTFSEGSNTVSFKDSFPIQPGVSVACKIVCFVDETNGFINTATVHGGGAPDRTSAPVSFKALSPREDPHRIQGQAIRPIP
jgi:uncharacterized repeat protein (TIGR01451 family)